MIESEDSDQVLIDKLLLKIRQLELENKMLKAKQGQHSLSRTATEPISLSQLRILERPSKSSNTELEDKLKKATELVLRYAKAIDFV